MKNLFSIIIFFCAVGLFTNMNAQVKTPSASPFTKIEQAVGMTDITLEYSRPSVKGRTIFAADGLVPYGKVWRTGANAAVKITFSKDVKVQGAELAAGSYAILTTPGKDSWSVHFFPYESGSWSSYKEATPTAVVTAKPIMMPKGMMVESFMMMFNNLKDGSADLEILWADVNVVLNIELGTDKEVMANIDKVMAGPSTGDYYNAASYYHSAGKDLDKALMWVQKATNVAEPKFWQVRKESLILADMGKHKEAIEAAKKSLMLAEKAGNDDYIKMNKDAIAKWGSM